MLKNYLRIAWRTLAKYKANAAINISGLAIGIACFTLILLFVQDELSYDKFHGKADRIYRIAGEYDQGGDSRNRSAMTTYLLKKWLDASFSDIKSTVRLDPTSGVVKQGDTAFSEEHLLFADQNFFDVFTFPLLHGEPAAVLAAPNSMAISRTAARKYFGSADPLGQVLQVNDALVKITGVFKDMPANSHFHGDFIISMATAEPYYPNWVLTNSTGISHYTYVELAPGITPDAIESQLAAFLKAKDERYAENRTLFLQPLRDIHLRSNLSSEIEANGDIMYVYLLSAVAVIIIFMACINYMNLAVARSTSRSKEVGLRKVVGASRKQLVLQFLGESVITAFLALLLAAIVVELALPYFNNLAGKAIEFNLLQNSALAAGLLLVVLIAGIVAGSYPAAFLSALKSVTLLKGNIARSGGSSEHLRRGLVLVQFTASVALLVSTLMIFHQLNFMRTKKLGIEPEHVVVVPLSTNDIASRFERFRTVLLSDSRIQKVAATNNALPARVSHWREYDVEGLEERVMIPTTVVTHDFFATLQGELVAGRDFERAFPTDTEEAYIINETAAKFLGLESPVGRAMTGRVFNGSTWGLKQAKIVGVVRDFHFASLHTEIQPAVFSLATERTTPLRNLVLRISSTDVPGVLAFVEATWQKLVPERPFSFTFLDEEVEKMYRTEQRFLSVFLAFTVLAIVVTCLGVLGLSAYAAAQRKKEIGIRKVLGASVMNIVGILSSGFVKLMLVANLIAWPIAWWLMNRWLEGFAYRTSMSWWLFVLASVIALAIALMTVSSQAIRAALANPVASLRSE